MSISQLSHLAAVARVNNVANPSFIVQRGFREVRQATVAPGPFVGFCQLLFDSIFGLPAPDECVVTVSPESQIVLPSANAAVDWQWYFDPTLEEWTLLVVTSDCDGALPRVFNLTVQRVN